ERVDAPLVSSAVAGGAIEPTSAAANEAHYKALKANYTAALFDRLISVPWTEAIEKEAFQRLRELTPAGFWESQTGDQPSDAELLAVQLPALYRFDDAMVANRNAKGQKDFNDKGEVDKLTRTELAAKNLEIRKAAFTGVAEFLAAQKDVGPLAPWIEMEQSYLDVKLGQHLAEVEKRSWKILGDAPPKPEEISDEKRYNQTYAELLAKMRQQWFDALLRQRAFVTVMNLAARQGAEAASIDKLLKFVDAGMAQGKEVAGYWRSIKFQLLVALDRPDELQTELRAWIRADESTAPWRKYLALLLAERGNLKEAIGLFEACEREQLLTSADFQMLSDWYLAENRRADYDRAHFELFKQMPEQYLSNVLNQVRFNWQNGSPRLPTELDENTLLGIRALFEKSANPENYLWQLRELYMACRDFRLLQMLPDAVLGRSPQQIYSFLTNLQNSILGELRNEATADQMIAEIKKLRASKTAPDAAKTTPTDLRALDLLEAIIERRASEVLNQPGPHAEACLADLKTAFDRKFTDGEPRLMATFLKNLGTLRDQRLIDEQLREMRE
ncbi:MAG TPA: hypothetical protein VGJ15_09075, partial [Pirellulales bacterium]